MNSNAVPRLEPAIRTTFAPALREDGFKGTGRKFYKNSGGWLQFVNLQGSQYGGSFAVNLAIHFASAPDVVGNPPEPKKMTDAHCEFRRRLSEGTTDMWWNYESNSASILAAVTSAARMYSEVGQKYFAAAIATLDELTPERLSSGNYDLQGFHSGRPRLGFALARVRKLQGKSDESREFASYALQHLQVAVAWKPELSALAAK